MRLARTTFIALTAAAALALVAAAPAAANGGGSSCNLNESRRLVVGDAGFVGVDNVSSATEEVPASCQQATFSLTGSNPQDDFDIDFYDADGNDLDQHTNGPGDETGTIPAEAVEARVTYWAGAGGEYTLQAPRPTESPDQGDVPENPITTPTELYLHSRPTGVGTADLVAGASEMTREAPTDERSDVWVTSPLLDGENPNTIYEANWRWTPDRGFSFQDATVGATFWATTAGGPTLGDATFQVGLHVDGQKVASKRVTQPVPGPTSPAKFTPSFSGLDLAGRNMTLTVEPVYVDLGNANAVFYNSTTYPSGLDVAVPDLSTQVEDLVVESVGSQHVQLAWSEETLPDGRAHYRVYRTNPDGSTTIVAEPDDTAFLDRTVEPGSSYTYSVAAVAFSGAEAPRSDPVDATTEASDDTAPSFQARSVDPAATVVSVSWRTSELTEGRVAYGPTTDRSNVVSSEPARSHEVLLTGVEPGRDLHVNITATDMAGNTARTDDIVVTTSTDRKLYLHRRPSQGGTYLDEQDTPGDVATTYNDLGGAGATASGNGVNVLPVRNAYPARPAQPVTIDLREDDPITATIYVRDYREPVADDPRGGEFRQDAGSPNRMELNLTLYANGDQILAQGTTSRTIVGETGYTPFPFILESRLDHVDAGTLRAVVRPETATSGFAIGYEGEHASLVALPVEEGLDPQASVDVSPEPVVAGTDVTLEADAVGAQDPSFAWDLDGDGATDATGRTVTHAFALQDGAEVMLTVTDGVTGAQGTVTETFPVRQGDFVDDSRTVVAVLDTGINPYHPTYRRPGIELPLDRMRNHTGDAPAEAPRTIDLADAGDWQERVRSYRKDRADWRSIDQGELVHFDDTNVLGISFADNPRRKVLDSGLHGTATSSTALSQFPNAIIVMVQVDTTLAFDTNDLYAHITEGMQWAVDQPWIDVISMSLGLGGNAPTPSKLPELTKEAAAKGKVVVGSSGNDPSPLPTDSTDGPPWVISVTGSQEDGRSKEVLSSNIYPDYQSDFTVQAADSRTTKDTRSSISGTSFSAPTVAGTIAGIVHQARQARDHQGGIVDGNLVKGTGPANPAIDRTDLRAVLNRTAILRSGAPDYLVGQNSGFADHTHPPKAPFLTAQWGHVDERIIPEATADLLQGDLGVPTSKTDVWLYKKQTYETRAQYWNHVGLRT